MRRDTDRDWQLLGETEPYWGVLANNKYLRENLTDEVIEEFYETGVLEVAKILRDIRQRFSADFRPCKAIDFGCGVGRLTLPMADIAEHVSGVDVAPSILALAEQARLRRNVPNVSFHTEIPAGPVDWINSLICFQHIPPSRGYVILEQLVQRLAPGGAISIQVTGWRGANALETGLRAARRRLPINVHRFWRRFRDLFGTSPGLISMFDYDIGRILAGLASHGISNVMVEHTDHGDHHNFLLIGMSNRAEGPTECEP